MARDQEQTHRQKLDSRDLETDKRQRNSSLRLVVDLAFWKNRLNMSMNPSSGGPSLDAEFNQIVWRWRCGAKKPVLGLLHELCHL